MVFLPSGSTFIIFFSLNYLKVGHNSQPVAVCTQEGKGGNNQIALGPQRNRSGGAVLE